MTDAERALWRLLRDRRLQGWRFRRQEPIDRYIVDFICFGARLIIEVDGGQRADSESDKERDGVYQTIMLALHGRAPSDPHSPSSSSG